MTATTFSVLAPDVCGPLAVFPVVGDEVALELRSFAEAAALGATVRELGRGADVNRLVADNPLDVPVLLYEGEEVRGAQQDRTLDVSVLVPAGGSCEIPVTCVEHGRWDGSRHREAFAPAPVASHPRLRRLKNTAARATGVAAMAQGEVWQEVARVSAAHGALSDTGALRDAFAGRGADIDALRRAVSRRDGQLGSVCCLGGEVTVLDWVGRAEVFAALHGPLVAGYALDAAEAAATGAGVAIPTVADVERFVAAAVLAPRRRRRPACGLGDDVRFATEAAQGSALEVDGEVVALTAFPGETAPAGRIRRPSRRSR